MNAPLSPDMHSYWLFALAGKHTLEDALRFKRRALTEPDWWQAESYSRLAKRLRDAAWEHLEAARSAKRSAAR